jgi:SAM-dependent methyltransferase
VFLSRPGIKEDEGLSVVRRHYGPLCAEFYDLTKPVDGHYADVPYYLRRLAGIRGRVLEVAVGTGRLMVPLLRAGVQVDGIDSSPEMLSYCRRNCQAAGHEATLYCGALEHMDLPNRYDAIVITFGSFMLFSEPAEATAALDRMKRHLVPGGRVYLDVDAPLAGASRPDPRAPRRVVSHCLDGSTIVLVDTAAPEDTIDRIERRILSYEKEKDGRVESQEVQDFRLRHYELDEVAALLADAGFVNVDVCGDYSQEIPAANAQQWLCYSADVPSERGL